MNITGHHVGFNFSFITFAAIGFLLLCSCNSKSGNEEKVLEVEKKYQDSLTVMRNKLKEAQTKIELLSYPADQRLQKAKSLLEAGELDKAASEIEQLKRVFPNSSEALSCSELTSRIDELKDAKRKEDERIKALGFKALNIIQNVTIGENKITFSNFKIGLKYTHDVYPTYSGSEWREHTADKGSSFISCNMDVTSSSKDPDIPTIAFYSVNGEQLIHQATFWVNFARWSDFGCYLGNEPDLKNDFAKVSTVKFRLGVPLEDINFKKPYVIVLKNANTQSRRYAKYENPPVSYSGDDGYPSTLTINNFKNGQFFALKIANL
jgi:hypothetical protein